MAKRLSKYVVVPFSDEEGRLEGDSSLNSETYVPYKKGMTVAEIKHDVLEYIMEKVWCEGDAYDHDVEAFAEDGDWSITGGWVIERKTLNIINSATLDAGGDSECYAFCSALKSQVQSNAFEVIE